MVSLKTWSGTMNNETAAQTLSPHPLVVLLACQHIFGFIAESTTKKHSTIWSKLFINFV